MKLMDDTEQVVNKMQRAMEYRLQKELKKKMAEKKYEKDFLHSEFAGVPKTMPAPTASSPWAEGGELVGRARLSSTTSVPEDAATETHTPTSQPDAAASATGAQKTDNSNSETQNTEQQGESESTTGRFKKFFKW
jgi:hypothetical protein